MTDVVEVGNIKFDVASGSKGKQVMVIDDDDVIPSFCSQKKVKLLSSNMSEGITAIGSRFEGGLLDLKNVLQNYAIKEGLNMHWRKMTRCALPLIANIGRIKIACGMCMPGYVREMIIFILRRWT